MVASTVKDGNDRLRQANRQSGPGARFSKVPIINGPGKLLPFTLKIEAQ